MTQDHEDLKSFDTRVNNTGCRDLSEQLVHGEVFGPILPFVEQSMTSFFVMRSDMAHPTTLREYKSMTTAR